MLQIIIRALFFSRAEADGSTDAVACPADTGVGVEAAEHLLNDGFLWRGGERIQAIIRKGHHRVHLSHTRCCPGFPPQGFRLDLAAAFRLLAHAREPPWAPHRPGSLVMYGTDHVLRRTAAISTSSGFGGTASTGHGACARQCLATGARSPGSHLPRMPVPTTNRSSDDRTASTRTAPGSPRTVRPTRVTPRLPAANAVSRTVHRSSTAVSRHSLSTAVPYVARLPSPPPGSCQARVPRCAPGLRQWPGGGP